MKVEIRSLIWIGLLIATMGRAATLGEAPSDFSHGTITADQIVERMEQHNQERFERLKHYTSERHYHVEYRGFPAAMAASMDVEATYDAPSSRSFRVVSQSGSGLLIDYVLKRLLKSEREAALDQSQTALTNANYNFALVGSEVDGGRQLYVLQVTPRVDRKLLYRGKIWVDANDYAVSKIEAEPAQNPSFWIKRTEIHHVYSKTGDFWLSEQNRSETKVRTGGTAILTIDYGAYRIEPTGTKPLPSAEGSASQ
jgi:hypothetical protein